MKNVTFERAKKRAEKKKYNRNKKKWYIVKIGQTYEFPLLLAPIAVPWIIWETLVTKIYKWYYTKQVWSDEKATKVLDKILPKTVKYDSEEDAYFYCIDWGNHNLLDNAPIGCRTWTKKFTYGLIMFIKDSYYNPNYIKTIDDSDEYEIWVKFTPKSS